MKEFILQPVADFSEQLGEREIVTVSVGLDGNSLVLTVAPGMTDERFVPYVQPGWTKFFSHNSGSYGAYLFGINLI